MKWLAIGCLVLLLAGGVMALRVYYFLSAPNFTQRIADDMTAALGRKVTVDNVELHWGNPLVIHLRNLHLANADWGSEPDMLHIGELNAEIDTRALWRGKIKYNHLVMDDFDMLLERNAGGLGNWRLDGKPHPPGQMQTAGGMAIIPKDRAQFPILMDMQLHRGLVRLRTSSGKILRIAADNFAMRSEGEDTPVHLSWHGGYNNIPAQLDADMESYRVLNDNSAPYHTHVTIALSNSKLDFTGTMMNPLDADGMDGQLQIQTTQLGQLLAMMGMDQPSSLTLNISGSFTRQGDHWRWHDTKASLAKNNLGGDLSLDEGARGQPDHMDFKLSADQLNLKTIWDGLAAGPKMQFASFNDTTNLFLNLRLTAQEFLYGSLHVFSPAIKLRIAPGEVALEPSSFMFMDGKTVMSGTMTAADNNLQFNAAADVAGGNMTKLMQWFHAGAHLLTGNFDIKADMNMSGPVLDTALKTNSHGSMVFSMHNGLVAKNLLEQSSTDLRTLFHHDNGQVPVQCLLGAVHMHNGIGDVQPVVLRTPGGGLTGKGKVDFMRQNINIVMQSNARQSGNFALDIPLRISGPFTHVGISPAFGAQVPHENIPRDCF